MFGFLKKNSGPDFFALANLMCTDLSDVLDSTDAFKLDFVFILRDLEVHGIHMSMSCQRGDDSPLNFVLEEDDYAFYFVGAECIHQFDLEHLKAVNKYLATEVKCNPSIKFSDFGLIFFDGFSSCSYRCYNDVAILKVFLKNNVFVNVSLDKFGVCKYNYIIDKNYYVVKNGKFVLTCEPVYNEINIRELNDVIKNTFKIKRC